MLVVIDNAIPYIKGVLEPYMDVEYAPGDAFRPVLERYRGVPKCLIIRTRTKCNKALLEDSNVCFIASATIGEDHIDKDYCQACGIGVASAPGCNSAAVMQYVFTAMAACGLLLEDACQRSNLTMGVIGAGNVGEKVARLAQALGMRVMRNDPPKQAEQQRLIGEGLFSADSAIEYFELEDVLENSDILTLHTPLNSSTVGLAGKHFFQTLKKGAHLINASRGPVVDDDALLASKKPGLFLSDVWNCEPAINERVLDRAALATPHIAGYSVEGKQNATDAVVRASSTVLPENSITPIT